MNTYAIRFNFRGQSTELDAFVLKIRKEAGDVLGKRSWQRLAKVVRGEIEAKDLAQPGKHPKEITASNKK